MFFKFKTLSIFFKYKLGLSSWAKILWIVQLSTSWGYIANSHGFTFKDGLTIVGIITLLMLGLILISHNLCNHRTLIIPFLFSKETCLFVMFKKSNGNFINTNFRAKIFSRKLKINVQSTNYQIYRQNEYRVYSLQGS